MIKDPQRIEAANKVLSLMHPTAQFAIKDNYLCLIWIGSRKKVVTRRYSLCSRSFYPSWSDSISMGGTQVIAMTQLAYWIRHQPCLPLASWRYWSKFACFGDSCPQILKEAGYPDVANCIRCGADLSTGGYEWCYLDEKAGVCCTDQQCLLKKVKKYLG